MTKIAVPPSSALQPGIATADFHEAYAAPLRDSRLTATEIFLRSVQATPSWVGHLMALRDLAVRGFGLKLAGPMTARSIKPADAYQIGGKFGAFTILGKTDDKLVLGIDDRHLDVRLSFMKTQGDEPSRYVISTTVKIHNLLGHVYMLPVGRIHGLVIGAMMRHTTV